MSNYTLSLEAQRSLRKIKTYSLNRFGKEKTREYLRNIQTRFRDLAQSPSIGKHRAEIKQGIYSSFIGSHTIYYRIKNSTLEVIDVLHQSMDPNRHLY